jgi:hypothetical protein
MERSDYWEEGGAKAHEGNRDTRTSHSNEGVKMKTKKYKRLKKEMRQ